MKYYIQFSTDGLSMVWWGSSPPAIDRYMQQPQMVDGEYVTDAEGKIVFETVENPDTTIPTEAIEVTEQQYTENLRWSSPLKWIGVNMDANGVPTAIQQNSAWPDSGFTLDSTTQEFRAKTELEKIIDLEISLTDYRASKTPVINMKFRDHFQTLQSDFPEMAREQWPFLVEESIRFQTDRDGMGVTTDTIQSCAALITEVLGDTFVSAYQADPSTIDLTADEQSIYDFASNVLTNKENVRIFVASAKYKRNQILNDIQNYVEPAQDANWITNATTFYNDIESMVNGLVF